MALTLLILLILLNGLFSMSEMALVSSRKARLQQRADTGSKGAKMALSLADNPSHFLSTVQVGITTIGILSGAFGENAIAAKLIEVFQKYPTLAPHSHLLATIIMVLTITYFSVVVGELVPKRLALLKPEAIAAVVATPMYWLSRVMHPLVAFISFSGNVLLRVLGANSKRDDAVSEEEVRVLIDQGTEAGVFEKSERVLISNVFQLNDLKITAIMTPRKDVVYLDVNASDKELKEILIAHAHSRLPVCRGGFDQVVGVVGAKDLFAQFLSHGKLKVESTMHKPLYVPKSITPMTLLDVLRKSHESFAVVVDEYGSASGVVTLADVLEAIVGELPFSVGGDNPTAVRREDGSWLVDGGLSVRRFEELLGARGLAGEKSGAFHTVGGFLLSHLGHIPVVGECYQWGSWRFEVIDMDHSRIDKILLSQNP
jgi:putative hemolysin